MGPIRFLVKRANNIEGEEQRKGGRLVRDECPRFRKSLYGFARSPLHWCEAGLSLERNTE
jgi:hypothetical protein